MLQLCAALYESSSNCNDLLYLAYFTACAAGESATVTLTHHTRIVRAVATDFQLILSLGVCTKGTHESAIIIMYLECVRLR